MAYHLRIETSELGNLLSTRCRNSELWFVNNLKLEQAVLGYAAKFAHRYSVSLYALAIEGNHIHTAALFPEANRMHFMRDFNSCVARAVARLTPEYPGGRLWARRYSNEFLPNEDDIEAYFWYVVLQPIQDGLVERLSDYPGYSCFHDAVYGIERKLTVVRYTEYHAALRHNPAVSIDDYTEEIRFSYPRLPGYEHLSQREYAKLMHEKLEARRLALVQARYAAGLGFVGRDKLLRAKRGSRPRYTKTSTRQSHRPRILSVCNERRAKWKAWYFDIYFRYQDCSKRYRAGEDDVVFPEGTYPPWRPPVAAKKQLP